MNRLWRITGIAWVAIVLSGWSAPVAPPYSDDFEGYTNLTPLIDGTNGWYGSDPSIIVQTNIVHSGLHAAQITSGSTLSNRCLATATNNIWLQMDARLVSCDEYRSKVVVDPEASALFFIDANGFLNVHDGAPTNWVTITHRMDGAALAPISATNWTHLYVWQDYLNKKWALFLGYDLIKDNIGFVNTNATNLNGFDISNGGGNESSFLDNVSLITSNPPELRDHGTNWMPYLIVDQTNLTRSILEGSDAFNQTFEIWKTNGPLSLAYSCSVSADWLTVNPSNGITAGEYNTIDISYSTADLPASPDPYTATIVIEGRDATFGYSAHNSPWIINVALLVKPQPVLQIEPTELTSTVSYGQHAPTQRISVWNDSAEPRLSMPFSASSATAWIDVTPNSGSCQDNTNTLTLAYATESLTPGWYTGQVNVVTDTQLTNATVIMRVNAIPVLGVNISHLTNSATAGQTAKSQTFAVYNASAEPQGTLRYHISADMTWATLSANQGSSSGETNKITVNYNTAGLPLGVHTGNITVASFDAASDVAIGQTTISVVMLIKDQPQLNISTDRLVNSVATDGEATDTFQLWNGGVNPPDRMFYMISKNVSWLSVTPDNGSIIDNTNTIYVSYIGSAPAGTHLGTITIDAFDMLTGARVRGAPKTITVKLLVMPRKPINYAEPEVRGILQIGQTLGAWRGLWQNDSRLSFAYQWQMANDVYGNGLSNITDAAGTLIATTNYVVASNARGKYLRVKVTATDAKTQSQPTIVYSSFSNIRRIKAAPDDFDGDGLTDLWIFDAASGIWSFAFAGGNEAAALLGWPGCLPVPADYDGDGKIDPAVYDVNTGLWAVMLSASQYAIVALTFGGPGYLPLPNDYDGDGKNDPALYEEATGLWLVLLSAYNYPIGSIISGGPGCQPVPADYDGDGKTDPATYHAASGLWTARLSASAYAAASLGFGGPEYMPVPGDYDGDGLADIAVYMPSGNHWFLRSSLNGVVRKLSFGVGAGFPVPGYYDHDAHCDPATVRLSSNFIVWSIQRSALGYSGQSYQTDTGRWRVSW